MEFFEVSSSPTVDVKASRASAGAGAAIRANPANELF